MLRRLAAAATSISLALAGALVAPVAAHADDYCDWSDDVFPTVSGYAPSTLRIGLTPPLVRFSVRASDDCGIAGWSVSSGKGSVYAYHRSPTDKVYVWSNADAGSSYMDVEAYDTNYNTTTKRFGFRLLRAAYWSGFNASPEQPKKGKYVTVTGTLKRADWDRDQYVRFGAKSQRAKIQFLASGTSTYKTIRTVTLDKNSAVNAKFKISGTLAKDGIYRLVYGGNGVTSSAISIGDHIDVR